jgi:hypothetical protein
MSTDRFAALRTALVRYDAHVATLDTVESDAAAEEWAETEKTLGDACASAFADATADLNSRESALLCRPCYWTKDDFLHRVAYGDLPNHKGANEL